MAENQASSADHLARRDQDIHVGRDPERVVPIKRFGQGNAFQRDRGHSGLVQEPEQARQFLGEEHAPDRIDLEGVRQPRADRVRNAGELECRKVAIDERSHLVGASAREQQVPAQRGGEQFKRPAARPKRQLAAGKQQAELVFGCHVRAHKSPQKWLSVPVTFAHRTPK